MHKSGKSNGKSGRSRPLRAVGANDGAVRPLVHARCDGLAAGVIFNGLRQSIFGKSVTAVDESPDRSSPDTQLART